MIIRLMVGEALKKHLFKLRQTIWTVLSIREKLRGPIVKHRQPLCPINLRMALWSSSNPDFQPIVKIPQPAVLLALRPPPLWVALNFTCNT